MGLLAGIFNTVLYQPLFNVLILIYQYLPGRDFGLAVIILTVLIRLILSPLMAKSIRSQKALAELQPKIQEVQQKYKEDKERQLRETMGLYRKEKISPLGGFLPVLIQLPILIALYQVFWKGLQPGAMENLYGFVSNPGVINPLFLNIINLSQASLVLAILAGVAQFFQTKMTMVKTPSTSSGQAPKKDQTSQFSEKMQKQMLYFFPVFTVFILGKLPAAIGLYWIVTTLFSIVQQYFVYKKTYAPTS